MTNDCVTSGRIRWLVRPRDTEDAFEVSISPTELIDGHGNVFVPRENGLRLPFGISGVTVCFSVSGLERMLKNLESRSIRYRFGEENEGRWHEAIATRLVFRRED
ncbi:MAG TPA: hypothetical protein VGA06_00450 [Candidatus Paceibacterota bacterium]|jgi:hypothetical protein